MPKSKYFQVEGLEYHSIGIKAEEPNEIYFVFSIIPDGDTTASFLVRVGFPFLLLRKLRSYGSRGLFPSETDKQKLLRYAFCQLKAQLEGSSLDNRKNITLDHSYAGSLIRELPKQCEYLESVGEDLFCCADVNNPRVTSLHICENCTFPEPILRCDNLRIQSVDNTTDVGGECRIIPIYCCLGELRLPSDPRKCRDECSSFIPIKFYLEQPACLG
jgi:hypothetical protein